MAGLFGNITNSAPNWVGLGLGLSLAKSAEENEICDALSRLCTRICFDGNQYQISRSRLLKISKAARIRKRQMEENDPLVQKIAQEASIDDELLRKRHRVQGYRHKL